MADNTGIEWTDATWNIVTGCSVVSPGCTNCYAMRLAGTRLRHHPSRAGLTAMTKAGPVWTGETRFNAGWLLQPLAWKRPRRIFVAAHGDLFHPGVRDEWLDQVFAVMALAPHHTFQVLTKRPDRAREYLGWESRRAAPRISALAPTILVKWPLPNVWLGTSVENQEWADRRIPDLLATPAAVRFLSCEPLLGPIDIAWALSRLWPEIAAGFLKRGRFSPGGETLRGIDWVIAGGESGPGKRPIDPARMRSLRDQCAAAAVPYFAKQLDKVTALPPDLLQREMPDGRAAPG